MTCICNLLCFSYLLVLEDRAILYAQLDGISVDLIDALEGVVEFADYDQIADVLVDELKGKKLLVAKSELTVWLWKTLEDVEIVYGRSPITDIKKNKFKKRSRLYVRGSQERRRRTYKCLLLAL